MHSMKNIAVTLLLMLMIGIVSHAEESTMPATKTEKATLAGGCYWCIEAVFQRIPGVVHVTSGFTGGYKHQPTYRQVTTGETGHAEAVEIEFDPARITFEKILDAFWQAHDPTHLNRQGNDVGPQYRSAIFYHSEEQKKIAEDAIQQLSASGKYHSPIVTQVAPATTFYPADDEHQDYYNRNSKLPYCRFVIQPKLEKMGFEK